MTVLQPFPRTTPEAVGIPSAAIGAFVNNAERFELHSLMVLRHGKVCAEGWWKPYGPDKLHNVHSYTKTFLATALGIVVSQGKLSLEDSVLSFFPEDAPANPCENLRKMKLRHLLVMNTGQHREPDVREEKEFVKAFLAWPVEHEPGSWFCYNSNASHMIGRIIHKATGNTFVEILQTHVFEPMGFGKVECTLMADGFPAAGGGFALTTEDMARLAQLYLNRGMWNGKQLVPQAWIDAAIVPQCDNSNGEHQDGNEDWEAGYGYQLWQNEPLNSYRFDGMYGQEAMIFPDQDMAVIYNAATLELAELFRATWRAFLGSLSDTPLPENPGGHQQLVQCLENLKLPELRSKELSLLQEGINGREIAFPENDLTPVSLIRLGGAVQSPKPGISRMGFRFGQGELKLSLQTPEQAYEIVAGMDGGARSNVLAIGDGEVEFHAAARWTDQNVLSVALRQLRVVHTIVLTITFHLEGAELELRHTPQGLVSSVAGCYR